MKTAVITSLFNPAGYTVHNQKYLRFKKELGKDLKTIELSFNGQFISDDDCNSIHIQGNDSNILWQKERLLNALVERLDGSYDAIAYIDSDILFPHLDWLEKGEKALQEYNVVQLYDTLVYLGKTDKDERMIGSYMRNLEAYKRGVNGGCGGALIVRREMFPLIDLCILGGGDSCQMWAWTDRRDFEKRWRKRMLPETFEYFHKAAKEAAEKAQGKVGYINNRINHIYHGDKEGRFYNERWQLFKKYQFRIEDLVLNDQKVWQWVGNQDMQDAVKRYFLGRNEDGIEGFRTKIPK